LWAAERHADSPASASRSTPKPVSDFWRRRVSTASRALVRCAGLFRTMLKALSEALIQGGIQRPATLQIYVAEEALAFRPVVEATPVFHLTNLTPHALLPVSLCERRPLACVTAKRSFTLDHNRSHRVRREKKTWVGGAPYPCQWPLSEKFGSPFGIFQSWVLGLAAIFLPRVTPRLLAAEDDSRSGASPSPIIHRPRDLRRAAVSFLITSSFWDFFFVFWGGFCFDRRNRLYNEPS